MNPKPNDICTICGDQSISHLTLKYNAKACKKHRKLIMEAINAANDEAHFYRLIGVKQAV